MEAPSQAPVSLGSKNKLKKFLNSRLLLVLGFLAALTVFLHFREVRVEILDLNTKAPRYVIAQIDFSFPDEEATLLLKQEAVREIGGIYRIYDKEIEGQRLGFESYLVRDPVWRKKLQKTSFEKMYKAAGLAEDFFIDSRYTDARTLQRIEDLHFPVEHIYLFTSDGTLSSLHLPKQVFRALRTFLMSEGYEGDEADFISSYFEQQRWNLQEDLSGERNLRSLIQSQVPIKYTKVEAGSSIIDKGEKVTSRHITMLQSMKKAMWEARKLWQPLTLLGSFLLAALITLLTMIYFRINHPDLLSSFPKMTLLLGIVVLTLFLTKGSEYFLLNKASNLIDFVRYPLFVPFATILLCLLLGSEIALFISVFLIIVIGVSLAIDWDRFLMINLIACLVALISARSLHKRKEVFSVCGKIWLSCIPVILSFSLFENAIWNLNVMSDLVSTASFLFLTSILVVGLLPILESAFHVTTDMTLMEYMDPNNELLRRLSLEAPGTYQHCLVVGSLAESAARAIGASGLFCRVSTLYHDIGKLFNPHYFTENQLGGFNIHQLLTPQESAHVIMAHVSEGVDLARKYHLPQSFIDIIKEHHGTTLVYYFYHKEAEREGGDFSRIGQKSFRYNGPKPHTKESALIMIADTIEAAARSMDEVTEESLTSMVSQLIDEKREDGQFDECQLTFEELGLVKKTIVRSLLVTRHLRIKYPTRS